MLESLDPRVNRLNLPEATPESSKQNLDQLPTFEVFVQAKEGRPFQHEGIVHASDEEMGFLFAKEQFSRRYTCTGIWVVKTENIHTTPFTDGDISIYDQIPETDTVEGEKRSYDIFHLLKRGKQHRHVGAVEAVNEIDALCNAASQFGQNQTIYNVWIVESDKILRSDEETKEIWNTLPDKSFRDAISYKAGDKIKKFKETQA